MPGASVEPASAAAPDRPFAQSSGIGLKAQFYKEVLDTSPPVDWFEVHPENYMIEGGPPLRYLRPSETVIPCPCTG